MDWLTSNIQAGQLDSLSKYSLVILNFITIGILYAFKKFKGRKKTQQKHSILFVIAHPDDQAMYFQPTINELNEEYTIHVLCLWANPQRQGELKESLTQLGIIHVHCLHDERLVDGMKEKWDEQVIKDQVKKYVTNNNIRAVFSFDDKGISAHPNHIATSKAINQLTVSSKTEKSIKFYQLQSVSLFRKYTGVWDLVISLLSQFLFTKMNPINSYRVMSKHRSQFVWFRKLFIIFSRYTYVNTYKGYKFIEC